MKDSEFYIETAMDTSALEKGISMAEKELQRLEKQYQSLQEKQTKFLATGGQKQVISAEYKKAVADVDRLTNAFNNLLNRKEKMEIQGTDPSSKAFIGLEEDIKRVERQLEAAEAQKKLLEDSKYVDNPVWVKMQYDIAAVQKRIENTRNVIEEYNGTLDWMVDREENIEDMAEAFEDVQEAAQGMGKKVKTAFTGFGSMLKKGTKAVSDFGKSAKNAFGNGFTNLLKYTLGISGIMAALNKLRSFLTEGIRNLARFNDGINPTNEAISNLKSGLTQLKNGLAAAFAPILTVVEPILTRFIGLINSVVDSMGMLIAKMTGQNTFTKAIKVQENYAKSMGATAKSAKEAKRQLASFYDLNVLGKSQDDTGADYAGVDPNKMFQEVQIPSNIATLADKLQEIIQPFKDSLANWFTDLDFEPLIDSFTRLKEAAEPLASDIGEGLLWLLENVIEPIGTFTIEEGLPHFMDMLSAASTSLHTALEELSPSFQYFYDHVLKPIGEFTGEAILWFIDQTKEHFAKLGDLFAEKGDKIRAILDAISTAMEVDWEMHIKPTLQFIMGFVGTLLDYIINVVGDIIDVLYGVVEFLTGVFTGDWEKAWQGIKDIFFGIFNGILDIFEGVVNSIIDGINSISIDVPDYVPGIGGTHIGFDLARLQLPRLASGTVIPRSSQEFAAILGDNNREAEVVSPLSTMKEAMIEALQSAGGGNVNVTVVLEGEADGLFRVVKSEAQRYYDRNGYVLDM